MRSGGIDYGVFLAALRMFATGSGWRKERARFVVFLHADLVATG